MTDRVFYFLRKKKCHLSGINPIYVIQQQQQQATCGYPELLVCQIVSQSKNSYRLIRVFRFAEEKKCHLYLTKKRNINDQDIIICVIICIFTELFVIIIYERNNNTDNKSLPEQIDYYYYVNSKLFLCIYVQLQLTFSSTCLSLFALNVQ